MYELSDLLTFLFFKTSVFIPCPPSLSLRRDGRGGFPYPWSPPAAPKAGKPLSSFLFSISGYKVLIIEYWNLVLVY